MKLRKNKLYCAVTLSLTLILSPKVYSHTNEWKVEDGGNGHFYEFVYAETTWSEAKTNASQLYNNTGYLAAITSQTEQDWICSTFEIDLSSVSPFYYTWIGGYQDLNDPNYTEPGNPAQNHGGWKWVTGETWDFTDWAATEPNNWLYLGGYTENVLVMSTNAESNGEWNDFPAEMVTLPAYIAEWNSNPVTAVPEPSAIFLSFMGCCTLFHQIKKSASRIPKR
ncbi:MAG: hypothetical protein AB1454_05465 [Candidatus Auribacterota bacterium]